MRWEGGRQGCGSAVGGGAKLCSYDGGSGVPGMLAAVLRLVRKRLLCQGQPVPVLTLLLAEKVPGQSFKELREDVGC